MKKAMKGFILLLYIIFIGYKSISRIGIAMFPTAMICFGLGSNPNGAVRNAWLYDNIGWFWIVAIIWVPFYIILSGEINYWLNVWYQNINKMKA